jgi:hypothetical protein
MRNEKWKICPLLSKQLPNPPHRCPLFLLIADRDEDCVFSRECSDNFRKGGAVDFHGYGRSQSRFRSGYHQIFARQVETQQPA